MKIDFLNNLVCPLCKGKLIKENNELICRIDLIAFKIKNGVPIMLESESKSIR